MTQIELLRKMEKQAQAVSLKDGVKYQMQTLRTTPGQKEQDATTVHKTPFTPGRRTAKRACPQSQAYLLDCEPTANVEQTYQMLLDVGALAPTSYLSGTVQQDGNIFNPYIHRTSMPLTVLSQVYTCVTFDDMETSSFDNYQVACYLRLAGRAYQTHFLLSTRDLFPFDEQLAFRRDTRLRLNRKLNSKYAFSILPKYTTEVHSMLGHSGAVDQEDRTRFMSTIYGLRVAVRRLCYCTRFMRFLKNLLAYCDNELRVAYNMIDKGVPEQGEARWGFNAGTALVKFKEAISGIRREFLFVTEESVLRWDPDRSKVIPLLEQIEGIRNDWDSSPEMNIHNEVRIYCENISLLASPMKLAEFFENPDASFCQLQAFELYVAEGLHGTAYSIKAFPSRYCSGISDIPVEELDEMLQNTNDREVFHRLFDAVADVASSSLMDNSDSYYF